MKKFFSTLLSVAMISSAFVSAVSADAYDVIAVKTGDTVIANGTNIEATVGDTIDFVIDTKDVNGQGLNIGVVYDDTTAFADAFEFTSITNGSGKTSYKIYNDVEDDDVGSTVKPSVANSNKNGLATWGFIYAEDANWSAVSNFAKFSLSTKKTGTYKFYVRNTLTVSGKANENNVPFTITVKDAAPEDVLVTDITADDLSLTVGNTGTIAYTVAPDNATDKKVVFESGDSEVIEVNAETGAYEAKKAGKTTITIKSNDGNATKIINVEVAPVVVPDKITFDGAAKSEGTDHTAYWKFTVSKGLVPGMEAHFADQTAEKELVYDLNSAIGGDADVSFALYITATNERIGHTFDVKVMSGDVISDTESVVID